MKLTGIHGQQPNLYPYDAPAAVQHHINCVVRRYDNAEQGHTEALQGMLGRLLEKLIANGALRAEQVSEIFDYDVIAEDD